jgi:DNA-binding PadR family transcriptional regulator
MDVEDQLPLHEATFFILLSLLPGTNHGYGIMQDVAALSNGRLQLSTGTLYGALKRLLELAWIERFDDPAVAGGGRERKAYRLTELGRRITAAETGRLEQVTAVAVAQQRAVALQRA